MLINLSEKPTISLQQFKDSTEEVLRKFPAQVTAIETLRSDLAGDFRKIQQVTESNTQRNFDQIH
jgi:hypothetical protein